MEKSVKPLKPPYPFDDYEILAIGQEKIVCYDPHNKQRVICFFRPGYRSESKRFIKARFYLTKILHLLFPDNIPDMIWTGYKPLAYASKKVETDHEHQEFNRLATRYHQGEWRLSERLNEMENEHFKKYGSCCWDLRKKLMDLEVFIDKGEVNFAISPDSGAVLYLDHVDPWYFPRGKGYGVKEWFNYSKIEHVIDRLKPKERKRVEKFLMRLRVLFEEEKAEFGDYEKIGKI